MEQGKELSIKNREQIAQESPRHAGTFYLALSHRKLIPYTGGWVNIEDSPFPQGIGNEWITGITVDGNDEWDEDRTERAFKVNLGVQSGYFIVDRLLMGIGIQYMLSDLTSINESEDLDGDGKDDEYIYKSKYNELLFLPFAKYYLDLGSNYLFISSSYSFGIIKSSWAWERNYTSPTSNDWISDSERDPIKRSVLEFGTGLSFSLTKSVALDPSLNYAFITESQDEWEFFSNAFYLKIDLSAYF